MSANSKRKKAKRPIVCETDFSATAVEAVDIAGEMARRLEVTLHLVHVEEFRGLAVADPGLFEQVVSRNREELAREIERLRYPPRFLSCLAATAGQAIAKTRASTVRRPALQTQALIKPLCRGNGPVINAVSHFPRS